MCCSECIEMCGKTATGSPWLAQDDHTCNLQPAICNLQPATGLGNSRQAGSRQAGRQAGREAGHGSWHSH